MSLSDNIHRMTRPHMTRSSGGPITVPSLLDQLAAAVHPSAAGGASGGSKIRIPIDAGAMSLHQDIDREAREHHRDAFGLDKFDTLEAIIQSFNEAPSPDWSTFLEHVTLDWVDRITALLEPAKPYRPSHACPACEQRFHGEDNAPTLAVYWRDEDGKQRHPHEWVMECGACTAQWSGKELGIIAHTIKEAA